MLRHLREEVGQVVCEMKEEIRKVVVGNNFFSKETTKVTLITLKLALEPLFFFALEFLLQNDSLGISCGIYFGITTITILRTLDSGTNIFAKVYTPQ